VSVSVDDLKAPGLWKFTAHADGSDKGGRFSINFYEAEFRGEKLQGFKKQWSRGGVESGYSVTGITFPRLADLAAYLDQRPVAAGDDKEARDD